MPFNFSSFIKTIKALFIEGVSLGFAFLADNLLNEPEEGYDVVRLAIDVRIYYLAKNALHLIDALLTKENDYRHLYNGVFNLGVAAIIHPASRLPESNTNTADIIATESLIYFGASAPRLLVEMGVSKQTLKQHVSVNRGKLIGGAIGVFISLVPAFGIATPAFYWSGELYDIWQKRSANETLLTILLKPKSTVPLQVFLAEFIKAGVKFSDEIIPFPEFIIDCLAGASHRLIIDRLNVNAPASQQSIMPQSLAIESKSIEVVTTEEESKAAPQVPGQSGQGLSRDAQKMLTQHPVARFNAAFFQNQPGSSEEIEKTDGNSFEMKEETSGRERAEELVEIGASR